MAPFIPMRSLRIQTAHPHRRGFTLIELLTVIAIIGILAAIIVPVVGRVRESAKRAQCVSNIRQLSMALLNYANQSKHQDLPVNGGTKYLPWDIQKSALNDLVKTAGRSVVFCPSAEPNDADKMWSTYPDYVAADYVLLVSGTKSIDAQYLSSRVETVYTLTDGSKVQTSQRELVVDAILRNGRDDYTYTTGNLLKRTNHMSGKVPAGGNIGFMDGHVKWRPFAEVVFPRGTGTPQFGW